MTRLFVALLSLWIALAPNISFAQSGVIAKTQTIHNPGYIGSKYYTPGFVGTTASNIAVPTLDTVVFLYPFSTQDYSLTAQSLNIRTVTGAASCAVKLAIWGTAASRPTGTPLVGSNTGQACTASPSTQTISISYTFQLGLIYWFGAAFTTAAPMAISPINTSGPNGDIIGRTALSSSLISALTAPYTYATDITTLDLTSASFTDVSTSGVPVFFLQCASTC